MKTTTFRISFIAVGLLGPTLFRMEGGSGLDIDAQFARGHTSGLAAKITLRDGAVRNIRLQGVGCPWAICSRTAIHAQDGTGSEVRTWLDNLVAIRDTTERDALFVMRDRTSRRMSLLTDFRVLYLANRLGGSEKLDLAKVQSVEFLASIK
jgi:hypothetical protein